MAQHRLFAGNNDLLSPSQSSRKRHQVMTDASPDTDSPVAYRGEFHPRSERRARRNSSGWQMQRRNTPVNSAGGQHERRRSSVPDSPLEPLGVVQARPTATETDRDQERSQVRPPLVNGGIAPPSGGHYKLFYYEKWVYMPNNNENGNGRGNDNGNGRGNDNGNGRGNDNGNGRGNDNGNSNGNRNGNGNGNGNGAPLTSNVPRRKLPQLAIDTKAAEHLETLTRPKKKVFRDDITTRLSTLSLAINLEIEDWEYDPLPA
ncbi:hypothetical protein P154DRAFT_569429 [Amniculicola lignicola CBS 123094]|uniref:Uncharacterized protein n=1 Tax=Amniculicola lignicola CBS 123094 TaxID=1392246 RepID=A0A6A5X3W5_9PLEO|nr:hypothetical protein P154DRAFT_569429 [Amniculicola lignicola CBS 123094]